MEILMSANLTMNKSWFLLTYERTVSVHLSFEFHSSEALDENASWLKAFLVKDATRTAGVVPLCDKRLNWNSLCKLYIKGASYRTLDFPQS